MRSRRAHAGPNPAQRQPWRNASSAAACTRARLSPQPYTGPSPSSTRERRVPGDVACRVAGRRNRATSSSATGARRATALGLLVNPWPSSCRWPTIRGVLDPARRTATHTLIALHRRSNGGLHESPLELIACPPSFGRGESGLCWLISVDEGGEFGLRRSALTRRRRTRIAASRNLATNPLLLRRKARLRRPSGLHQNP
jgi:hypothetical protein